MKVQFTGRLLVLGCGAVSQCTLPLLLKHLDMPRDRITVLDTIDHCADIKPVLAQGVAYVRDEIRRDCYGRQFSKYVSPGDMIVDLAWNLGCTDLLHWCHQNGVLYMNTSVELWDPDRQKREAPTEQKTLYTRQMAIRDLISTWPDGPGPTAILDHGANPGLISHFTKMALIDLGVRTLHDHPHDLRRRTIEAALSDNAFNQLAFLMGIKVIHVSEIDTQTTLRPKEPDEFVNTWSVEGFHEEGTAPAEMGWGTHEQRLPDDACEHHDDGPRNQICLKRFGINTFVRSRVPSCDIIGMVVRHGEAFSISESLTIPDERGAVYRPTVHYAYHPCEMAIQSLAELRSRNYELQSKQRIMSDEIVSGFDELGCLMMGHEYKSWWTGTRLDISEARSLVPGQNATTLQVAAAVVAAICWMIQNPRRGVLLPDQLPHLDIMEVARPYLGEIISEPIDWMPNPELSPESDAAWQFGEFLVEPQKSIRQREPYAALSS